LNGRSRTIITTKIRSDVSLFAVPAPPNSETISVEKESPMFPAALADHRIRADRKETTVPYMSARQCIYAQQLIETDYSFSATITAAPIAFFSVPDAVVV